MMRGYVAPLIQAGQVGNVAGVGRFGGHKVETKPETLEILPDGVQVGIAVVAACLSHRPWHRIIEGGSMLIARVGTAADRLTI